MIICDSKECTGCGACADICPKQCITMAYSTNNEYAPTVNDQECIHCDMCKKVCQVNNLVEHNSLLSCYVAWSDAERSTSASGGLAAAIADKSMENGVVVGCALSDNSVKHIMVATKDELFLLKGSKYSQSNTQGIYKAIENKAKEGNVTFFGTPCQVAGVKRYCEVKHILDKVLLVDLICHGVPSQKFIEDIVSFQPGNSIKAFRSGADFKLTFVKEPSRDVSKGSALYIAGFLAGLFYRESCYTCKYACPERVGDITVGDFWGIKNIDNADLNKGVSLVLVNTDKGKRMLDSMTNVYMQERTFDEASAENPQLLRPTTKHPNYDKFQRDYKAKGFCYAGKKSLKKEVFKSKVRNIVFGSKLLTKVFYIIKGKV